MSPGRNSRPDLVDQKSGGGEPVDEVPLAVLAHVVAGAEIFPPLPHRDDGRVLERLVDVREQRHQHDAEAAGRQDPVELAHRLAIVRDVLEHVRAQEDVDRAVRIGTVGQVDAVVDVVALDAALRYSMNG